jgi:hypothetical protein
MTNIEHATPCPIPLELLGGVVAYVNPLTGLRVTCSWMGATIRVWARFEFKDAELPPLAFMRDYLVAAYDCEGPRPDGCIEALCFKREPSYYD